MKSWRTFFTLTFLLLFISAVGIADNIVSNDESVFADPESLVRGLYASVTFEPGNLPDWDYVRSFFIPEAVFGLMKKDGRWWIVSITNDVITPHNPLPDFLRQ